jgi:uncharacterized membrane protein
LLNPNNYISVVLFSPENLVKTMKYGKGEDVSKAMKKADRLIEDINKKKADNEEKDEEGLPKTKTGKIEDKSQDIMEIQWKIMFIYILFLFKMKVKYSETSHFNYI